MIRGDYVMLKVLLADDEIGVIALLETILKDVNEIEIVGTANSVTEAKLKAIQTEPDVAILDIEFPDGKGTDLARELKLIKPDLNLVFITAHPNFALAAFELYSYDYILKPIDETRVLNTVNRLIKLKRNGPFSEYDSHNSKNVLLTQLTVKNGKDIILIDQDQILFLESNIKKVLIHCLNCSYETTESLNSLQAKLNENFFLSHKSFIINLKHVEKISSWKYGTFLIYFRNSNKKAQLSRRNIQKLRGRLGL